MSRPMVLIQEGLLKKLWRMHNEGVPVCKMIRREGLDITHPTLSKLLRYMRMMDGTESLEVKKIIHMSLFPEWLHHYDGNVVSQPYGFRYEGIMPIGKWINNDWAKGEVSDEGPKG